MTPRHQDEVAATLLAAAMSMDPSRNGVGAMLAWRNLSKRGAPRTALTPPL